MASAGKTADFDLDISLKKMWWIFVVGRVIALQTRLDSCCFSPQQNIGYSSVKESLASSSMQVC